MERPALLLLLADVAAGRVNAVVVYKVHRLTRSLADFARIVDPLGRDHDLRRHREAATGRAIAAKLRDPAFQAQLLIPVRTEADSRRGFP
jgi:hypothetical protein